MRALADLDVLIIDCQTTGASPAFGSVLELGWGVTRASDAETRALQAHWITLPQGHSVPLQVQKLTGYDPMHVPDGISDGDAWQRLRSTVASSTFAPTAIHYARFELSFLRDWAARLVPDAPFPIDAVCVHAIATRLYPELPRQSLRALAGYLGHGLDLTRRSLGHVEATAFVWRKLCAGLANRGIESWEQLQAWLAERAPSKPRPKKPKYPIAPERYKTLPDAPGVYKFLRSNGDVLYVGKAASLKKRAASHFGARGGTPQAPEMLTQVSEIEVTVVASALEAALLENETIKTLQPPYNVQLTVGDPRVWYSTATFEHAAATPDDEHTLGPVPSEYSLRPLAALIALAAGAPCSAALRSSAVGVSALWPPSPEVFTTGWAEFSGRHRAALIGAPRFAVLRLAHALLLSRAGEKPAEDLESAETTLKTNVWDSERVARHLERAAAQAYQTYRRARWLQLIHDSNIIYREPESSRARLLLVRGGDLLEASDAPSELAAMPHPRARRRPRATFDRNKYDRLRILTTELKRIKRDRGDISVLWGHGRLVLPRFLHGILRVV